MQCSRCSLTSVKCRGTVTSLLLLGRALLIQARLLFILVTLLVLVQLAVSQHPQVAFLQDNFPFTLPQASSCMGWLWPKCRTQNVALLNLIQLAFAHGPSLSRFLCKAFLPWSRTTFLPNLVLSANILRLHSMPSSRLLQCNWFQFYLS